MEGNESGMKGEYDDEGDEAGTKTRTEQYIANASIVVKVFSKLIFYMTLDTVR